MMRRPMASPWKDYAADGILRDGTSVHIRAIRPGDRAELARGFAELSPEAVYFRFFRVKQRLTEDGARRSSREHDFVAPRRAGGDAADRRRGAHHRDGALRRHRRRAARPRTAPRWRSRSAIAFQGRGLGTLLLEHLVVIARANGITEFEADVLGENNRMLSVFAKSGFRVKRSLADGVFHVTLPHRGDRRARRRHRAARARRPRRAACARSWQPRAVAVVGASRTPGTIGRRCCSTTCAAAGFTGPIYPVNPHADTIAGLPCHPTVEAIGQPVDLAVIAVPAAAVPDVVRDCARAGVRGVVVVSAGFAEASRGRDAPRERELVELVRSSGMRLVGPNCMGVLNTDPGGVAERHLRAHLARGRQRRHAVAERRARARRSSTTSAA